MTRKEQKQQMGEGQRMITEAEWNFGMDKSISLDELNRVRSIGNNLILNALDGIRGCEVLQECARCQYVHGAHGVISTTCPDGQGLFQ